MTATRRKGREEWGGEGDELKRSVQKGKERERSRKRSVPPASVPQENEGKEKGKGPLEYLDKSATTKESERMGRNER